jgi:hypothetical protein
LRAPPGSRVTTGTRGSIPSISSAERGASSRPLVAIAHGTARPDSCARSRRRLAADERGHPAGAPPRPPPAPQRSEDAGAGRPR